MKVQRFGRPTRAYAEWSDELGCSTLAALQRLPRAGLKKRCGTQLLDWLDQVAGMAPAADEWLEMPPSFDARVELMDRVEHAEALLFVARRLILQLTGWLTAKELDIAGFALRHERGRDAIAPTNDRAGGADATRGAPDATRLGATRARRVGRTRDRRASHRASCAGSALGGTARGVRCLAGRGEGAAPDRA
ncbi:hypothetical protein [Burkholderia sp. LMG 32019]|uniref:hypothetical protein n=1 Tax=Burkholderia sp. LMG 32019 TaxID=3158173 RepID=UPI003C2BE090